MEHFTARTPPAKAREAAQEWGNLASETGERAVWISEEVRWAREPKRWHEPSRSAASGSLNCENVSNYVGRSASGACRRQWPSIDTEVTTRPGRKRFASAFPRRPLLAHRPLAT